MNKTITITKTIVDIEIVGVLINYSAPAIVTFKEIYDNGDWVTKQYGLTQEEYDNWGTDDNYLKELIINKY